MSSASPSRSFCSQSVSRTCWNCQATSTKSHESRNNSAVFFCHECKAILPVDDELTYFQVMQCEQRYDLDVNELTQTFRSLQRQLHPDKYSIKPQIEQSYSADQSSAVNKAYSTLLKPLSRGLYLLGLNGYSIEENDSSVEPEFLMEIMEINEDLAETKDKEKVKQIRAKNSGKLTELIQDLTKVFSNNDFVTARNILVYLKYYANIEDKAKEILGTDA
ncbi:iron-sulfur cluster co-chaperone protein HscB-like [Amphiura filiformis]|uniref:iron-sulfur cluster co-chaperone protein HscB-like n=1 Tax=Amphiura filiformis TaxID=82378 RepID=UPI003B21A48E